MARSRLRDAVTGAPVPALFCGWRCGSPSRRSISRAMPVGDRRSVPALFRGWRCAVSLRVARGAGFRAPARCRSETGAPVPALFRGWRYAISLRVAQRCRVSRSRAMPVGDRRSPTVGDTRSRCASRSGAGFRAPARCRSETGAPLFAVGDTRSRCASRSGAGFALPRDAGRRPALQSPLFSRLAMRDLVARRAAVPGFALPRDADRRPALPLFRGWRCAISLRVAQRCRVSRSRAMPVGDRRSDAGRRPALRFFAVGDARSRCASRSGAGFRAPARCRSETGAPLFRGWRCAISLRVAQRCRVSRSRAMPVGDRRSFAVGDAPSGQLGSPGARGIRKKPS